MGRGWKLKLPDALWAYHTANKTPIGMSPYQLVYRKTCHLPIEMEHRAHRAIRKWNMDLKLAGEYWRRQISELKEWRDKAYYSVSIYKERTKRWHDKRWTPKNFKPGDKGIAFSIPGSSCLVTGSYEANGKDRTTSSTHHLMEPSRYMMTMVTPIR